MKIDFSKLALGILIAGIISWLLLRQVSITQIGKVFLSYNFRFVLGALLVLLIMNLLKAWRFSRLLFSEISARQMLSVVLLHNLFISFMPSRTGELSYFYLLKKRFNISMGQSVSSLMIARVLDVLVILLLIASTMFFVFRDQAAIIQQFLPLIGLGIFVLLAIFYLLLFQAAAMHNFFHSWFEKIGVYKIRLIGPIARRSIEILNAFTRRYSHAGLFTMTLGTFLIWILTFGFEFILYRGLGLQVSYWQFLVASLFPVMTHIIPVQSIGGVGTYEATITGGFVLLGFSVQQIIPMSFAVHAVQLVATLSLGVAGWLMTFLGPKPVIETPPAI